MNEITRLNQVSRSTPDELKELADDLRALADEIESGEIIALSWVEHRVSSRFQPRWVKARGITLLELVGGACVLVNDLTKNLADVALTE